MNTSFDLRFKLLLDEIGRPCREYNDDGSYQGCFYPVEFLYPKLPNFVPPFDDDDKNYDFGISEFQKYCIHISLGDKFLPGDIIVTRFLKTLHVAVYWEFGKIIHVFSGRNLEIGKIKMFRQYECFRPLPEFSGVV